MERRNLTQLELARRARVRPQTLNFLLSGRVKRCRRDQLGRLARAVGVSIAFLGGDPNAPPPGMKQAMLGPLLDEPLPTFLRIPEEREAVGRAEAEAVALLGDLDRVFFPAEPLPAADQAGLRADIATVWPEIGERATSGSRWSPPSLSRLNGARFAFQLDTLQAFVAGGFTVQQSDPETADEFAGHLSRAVAAILDPWTSQQAPVPPANKRLLCALARIATGLVIASLEGDTQSVDSATTNLEAIDRALTLRNYRPRT